MEDELVPAAKLLLIFCRTFLSRNCSANTEKSAVQSILPCSNLTITKLWKARASVQGRHSSTELTACSSTALPAASALPQVVIIKVKQEKNLANPMFSLETSSPSSSLAMICGHSSVLITGLFLIFAPDFTFFLPLDFLSL